MGEFGTPRQLTGSHHSPKDCCKMRLRMRRAWLALVVEVCRGIVLSYSGVACTGGRMGVDEIPKVIVAKK